MNIFAFQARPKAEANSREQRDAMSPALPDHRLETCRHPAAVQMRKLELQLKARGGRKLKRGKRRSETLHACGPGKMVSRSSRLAKRTAWVHKSKPARLGCTAQGARVQAGPLWRHSASSSWASSRQDLVLLAQRVGGNPQCQHGVGLHRCHATAARVCFITLCFVGAFFGLSADLGPSKFGAKRR